MKKRHWTIAEDAILKRYYPNNPTSEVALYFNRKTKDIHNRAKKLGLHKTPTFIRVINTANSHSRTNIIAIGAQNANNIRRQNA